MKINYGLNAKEVLNEIFPGGISDFEFSISNVCSRDNTTEISVYSLTPGLSGAAVFKINRLRNQNKLIPLLAKASKDKNQIQEEKDNCNKWISGSITNVTPRIIDSQDQYVLYFEYAAYLSNYNPKTLRDGYSDTSPEKLEELMKKIGDSLQQIQVISLDSMSVVDRMPELKDFAVLKEKLQQKELPNELIDALIRAWSNIKANTDECLMFRSTKAHGDLNSGNILHEPGQSYPVIIDFASMRKSDDNREYNEDYHHYPFWDYAKLERDIITRLFLKEADNEKISHSDIIHIVKYVCGNSEELSSSNKTKSAVEKLIKTLSALRSTRNHWFPQNTQACYRSVLAYSLTKMLFRKVPDSEFPEDIQGLVAVHAALTLLSGDS